MIRRRLRSITVAGALAVFAVVGLAADGQRRDDVVLAAQTSEDVTCQVEPLAISYQSRFAGGVYVVHTVNVSGIDPIHCEGAGLSIRLSDAAASDPRAWSGGPVTVTGSRMEIPLASAAPVEAVRRSDVTLIGGEVPVPEACVDQKAGNRTFGTPLDDNLEAPPKNSLVYALGGNDTVAGASGADCLVGGSGDDVLYGESGLDVLIGGTGDDRLYGGPGADVLWAGPGVDLLDGGNGKDICHLEGSQGSAVGCEDVRR